MSKVGPRAAERSAMHAADATGGEDADAGRMGRDHRRGHRRRGPAVAASAAARFGRAAFRTSGRLRERLEIGVRSSPTRNRPSRIAIVAGTAPPSRTAASDARATSRFCGYGRPWLMSVDSSATIGRRSASAARDLFGDGAAGQRSPSGACSAHRERQLGPRPRELPRRRPMADEDARWSAAVVGTGPRAASPATTTRNPASKASPAPVVSVVSIGRVATSKRRRSSLAGTAAGDDRRALRAALDDDEGGDLEQSIEAAAGERQGLGERREQDVGPRRRRGDPRRPAAVRRAAAGSTRGPRSPARRRRAPSSHRAPAGRAERLAEQRIGRQVQQVRGEEPVRRGGRPARAHRRRPGPPRRSARRSVADQHGDPARPPARRPRTARTRTPSPRMSSSSARPAASRPTAVMSTDRAPSRASQRAVVAAEPPWRTETRPGTSVPATGGRSGATITTSSIRSPRTMIRSGRRRERRTAGRAGHGRRISSGRRGKSGVAFRAFTSAT